MQPTHNSSECMPCAIVMPKVKHIYCMRTLTRYSRLKYMQLQNRCNMGIQWTGVLYSVVLTRQSTPPISQCNSPYNEFTSVWSKCVYNSNITTKLKANFKRVINIVYLPWKTLTQLENPMFVCQPTLPPKWIRLLSNKDSWLDTRSDVLISVSIASNSRHSLL